MARHATIDRKTKETDIKIRLEIDGSGQSRVDTGIPFMDHMLTLMAAHGFMDLDITAKGDTEIDDHHTVEDLGICLGQVIKKACQLTGQFASIELPDEFLVRVDDRPSRKFVFYQLS